MQVFFNDHSRQIRAVTFYSDGQRCETWLPRGTYTVGGRCNLSEGRGSSEMRPAVILKGQEKKNHGTWYVAPHVVPEERLDACCDQPGSF